jgi:hypothetical protein
MIKSYVCNELHVFGQHLTQSAGAKINKYIDNHL